MDSKISNIDEDDSQIDISLEGEAARLVRTLAQELGGESQVIGNALALYKWVREVQSVPGQKVALLKNGKPIQSLGKF